MVFHINDPSSLESILAAVGEDRAGLRRTPHDEEQPGDIAHSALALHESAMQAARKHLGPQATMAQIAAALSQRGCQSLAKRLRASARSRGAIAHLDASLA